MQDAASAVHLDRGLWAGCTECLKPGETLRNEGRDVVSLGPALFAKIPNREGRFRARMKPRVSSGSRRPPAGLPPGRRGARRHRRDVVRRPASPSPRSWPTAAWSEAAPDERRHRRGAIGIASSLVFTHRSRGRGAAGGGAAGSGAHPRGEVVGPDAPNAARGRGASLPGALDGARSPPDPRRGRPERRLQQRRRALPGPRVRRGQARPDAVERAAVGVPVPDAPLAPAGPLHPRRAGPRGARCRRSLRVGASPSGCSPASWPGSASSAWPCAPGDGSPSPRRVAWRFARSSSRTSSPTWPCARRPRACRRPASCWRCA